MKKEYILVIIVLVLAAIVYYLQFVVESPLFGPPGSAPLPPSSQPRGRGITPGIPPMREGGTIFQDCCLNDPNARRDCKTCQKVCPFCPEGAPTWLCDCRRMDPDHITYNCLRDPLLLGPNGVECTISEGGNCDDLDCCNGEFYDPYGIDNDPNTWDSGQQGCCDEKTKFTVAYNKCCNTGTGVICLNEKICLNENGITTCVDCNINSDCQNNPYYNDAGKKYCNADTHECEVCTTDEHCNDNNLCTTDTCTYSEIANSCSYTSSCNDGLACTGDECSSGGCYNPVLAGYEKCCSANVCVCCTLGVEECRPGYNSDGSPVCMTIHH